MNWLTLSKNEAEIIMKSWGEHPELEYATIYENIRKELLEAMNDILKNDPGAQKYDIDMPFGIAIYTILKKYGMNERFASNDGIWRYLSLKVIPDIVQNRWQRNEDRFWKATRRIWLKVVWWYTHLSWQGDEQKTREILSLNTADICVQLVERPGPDGYRVDLCREIMKQLHLRTEKKGREELFRKVIKLNTARVKVSEPSLFYGGVLQYVNRLFLYINNN